MRILMFLALLTITGCWRSTVREPKEEPVGPSQKSELMQLEDRLGV